MSHIALIDLSAIFRRAWHASENEEVSSAVNKTVAKVVASAAGYDGVAICCDRPPYKRKEIFAEYKAHREKQPASMYEQLFAVEKQLDADGYHLIGSPGYEADDIIATFVAWAKTSGHSVDIHSVDKDLMQLVDDKTSVISTSTGQKYGPSEVRTKMGVEPALISDLIALMGDPSDNIPGLKGVGIKTAADWLNTIGPLEVIMQGANSLPQRFKDLVRENSATVYLSWKLAQLMSDAPIKPEIILTTKEKTTAEAEPEIIIPEEGPTMQEAASNGHVATEKPVEQAQTTMVVAPSNGNGNGVGHVAWERSLEPKSSAQAWGVAQALYKSRLFGDFPNPEAIMAIVMTGRSLGMDTVASLRSFHVIKGKACPSAALLIGLVKRHHVCEWFRLVESTDRIATWETKRRDEPAPTRMSFTVEMAVAAQLMGNDNWKKRQGTMLRWRSGVELARAVYPDVVTGLYTIEEMEGES